MYSTTGGVLTVIKYSYVTTVMVKIVVVF